jgi:hypothetical protein
MPLSLHETSSLASSRWTGRRTAVSACDEIKHIVAHVEGDLAAREIAQAIDLPERI